MKIIKMIGFVIKSGKCNVIPELSLYDTTHDLYEILNNIPYSQSTCCFCLNSFLNGENIKTDYNKDTDGLNMDWFKSRIIILKCNHIFHLCCFTKYIKHNYNEYIFANVEIDILNESENNSLSSSLSSLCSSENKTSDSSNSNSNCSSKHENFKKFNDNNSNDNNVIDNNVIDNNVIDNNVIDFDIIKNKAVLWNRNKNLTEKSYNNDINLYYDHLVNLRHIINSSESNEIKSNERISSEIKSDVNEIKSNERISSEIKSDVNEIKSNERISSEIKSDVNEIKSNVNKSNELNELDNIKSYYETENSINTSVNSNCFRVECPLCKKKVNSFCTSSILEKYKILLELYS
jgi:hypothetical protein